MHKSQATYTACQMIEKGTAAATPGRRVLKDAFGVDYDKPFVAARFK